MGSTALARRQDGITVQDHLNGVPDRNRSVFAASDRDKPSITHHQRWRLAQMHHRETLAEHFVTVEWGSTRCTQERSG